MKRIPLVLAALSLATAVVVSPAGPGGTSGGKVAAKAVALTVAKPKPGDKFGGSMAFGVDPGTCVYFRIDVKDGSILKVDRDAGKLKAFADDKGTNLVPRKKGFSSGWIGWPKVDKDRHGCGFSIRNKEALPAAGATKVTAKGHVVLVTAAGAKTGQQANVALKKGSAVRIGPIDMKITAAKTGAEFGQKWAWSVTFTSSKDLANIQDLKFLDAAGKEIESRRTSAGSFGFSGRMTYTHTYSLARKVAAATIKISYFEKLERITVPFDAAVGVGL